MELTHECNDTEPLTEVQRAAKIVNDRLNYHFAGTNGDWNIPKNMPFMREFLNGVQSLCDLCAERGTAESLGVNETIIRICPDAGHPVVVNHEGQGICLCLHNDTPEEDAAAVKNWLESNGENPNPYKPGSHGELIAMAAHHLDNLTQLDQHNELSMIFWQEQLRHEIDMQPWIDEWHNCGCDFGEWLAKLPDWMQTRVVEYYKNLLKH